MVTWSILHTATWFILLPFGIFLLFGIFSANFGMSYQEKSGNPDPTHLSSEHNEISHFQRLLDLLVSQLKGFTRHNTTWMVSIKNTVIGIVEFFYYFYHFYRI
jgi:hypothetical protein